MSFEDKKYGDRDAMYQWAWGVITRGEIEIDRFTRKSLAELLQWNDRNGCYLDDLADEEDMPPITKKEAMDCMLNDFMSPSSKASTYKRIKLKVRELAEDANYTAEELEPNGDEPMAASKRQTEAVDKLWEFLVDEYGYEEHPSLHKILNDQIGLKWDMEDTNKAIVKLIDKRYE